MREALTGRRSEDAEKGKKDPLLGAFTERNETENPAAAAPKPAAPAAKPASGARTPAQPAAAPAQATESTAMRRPPRTKPTPFMRQKSRDRYLAARFPGAKHSDADLANTEEVIKSARLLFEDGDAERACEWLAFASDANPDEGLWLAQLEILFLKRNGENFTELAQEYHARFPESTHWGDVARLGARVTKNEPLFAGVQPQEISGDEHYGLWPQMQNWIQAPFDLTGDVLSAEFHAKMKGGGPSVAISAKAS
jgi:hypothetical protein